MRSDSQPLLRAAAALAALTLMAACSDSLPTERNVPQTPGAPQSTLAAFEVTVDEHAGVTYRRLPPGGAPAGVNAHIYGTQGVDVRLYNDPVVITPGALINSKTWSFNVGLQNLKPFPIGANQAGPAPTDTMGIYVFFTQDPVTTAPSPCSGFCSSAVYHFMGAQPFSTVAQPLFPTSRKYYFWDERVAAHGTGGVQGDTTQTRRTFEFVTGTNVTNFRFSVLVSAAWPPPAETDWKIIYNADSILAQPRPFPDSAYPAWKFANRVAPPAIVQTRNNRLLMTGLTFNTIKGQTFYLRRDSLASTENAYISADLFESVPAGSPGPPNNNPETMIALNDGTKFIGLGLGGNRVGFVTNSFNFILGALPGDIVSFAVNGKIAHNYVLQKYADDSATFFVDGVRRGRLTYSVFDNSTSFETVGSPVVGARELFGTLARTGSTTSTIDNVTYELGVIHP